MASAESRSSEEFSILLSPLDFASGGLSPSAGEMPPPTSDSHPFTAETTSRMDFEQAKMTLLVVTEMAQVIDVYRCKQMLVLIFMFSSSSQTFSNEHGRS